MRVDLGISTELEDEVSTESKLEGNTAVDVSGGIPDPPVTVVGVIWIVLVGIAVEKNVWEMFAGIVLVNTELS